MEILCHFSFSSECLMPRETYQPLVSILIPCHNCEQWIGKAIQSALGQTYENCEILVVDDGSTDQSRLVIESFADEIRIEFQENKGSNAARNRLLDMARGEWIQYLDADDFLYGDKIDSQIDQLARGNHESIDVLYSPITLEIHQEDGTVQRHVQSLESDDPWVLLARWQLPQTGSPLWRREALLDVGCWNEEQQFCQEHELYFRLLVAGKQFRPFNKPGAVYRIWSAETLCRKNDDETRRLRLNLLDDMEEFLRDTGQLDPARLRAINLTRFSSARRIWIDDPQEAARIMKRVRSSDPRFRPSGHAAPRGYRMAYRIAGFSFAERAAELKRSLFNK